jgi:diguanylate cyclase (GGDEF)-like protein/PAS domain S-box-containing protein
MPTDHLALPDPTRGQRRRKYAIILAAGSALMTVSLLLNLHREADHTLQAASGAARVIINKEIGFRHWADAHGGVYVAPTGRTPPNPYTSPATRDVVTTTGQALTRMEPDAVLRELQNTLGDEYGTRSHLASLQPLNPDNAADPWETRALRSFAAGNTELMEVQPIDGRPHLRLMQALPVDPGCPECHTQAGAKLNDGHGGIATAVPLAPYLAHQRERSFELALSHGTIWLIGLLGLAVSYRRERRGEIEREASATRLRMSENNLQQAQRLAQLGYFDYAIVADRWSGSDILDDIFGIGAEFNRTLTGWLQLVHPAQRDEMQAYVKALFEQHARRFDKEYRIVRASDGAERWVHGRAELEYDAQGTPQRMVGAIQDITERIRAEQQLRIAATAFEAQEGMCITDAGKIILRVNRAFTEVTGYTAEEVVGRTPKMLGSGRHDAAFFTAMWVEIECHGSWQGEIWNRRKNGEIYPEWLIVTAVKGSHGEITHYIGSLTDITLRKAAEDEIRHLAFYDPLTLLPNRRLLLDRLRQAQTASVRSGRQGALLFIDLDNFKALNDTLGHDIGDRLLQQVALRLTTCVRDVDTVARLGGDEFVVMLEEIGETQEEAATQTEIVAQKVLATLNQPYDLAGHECHSTASIGITLFAGQQHSVADLMRRADLTMYQAKAAGRNTLRFFDPDMQAAVQLRAALEADLRQAVREGQFSLYYQAQVDSAGRLAGAEALVRWRHPTRGLVLPNNFIPLAEDTGLILPIGHWVLETACAQLARWATRAETADLTLAVNVSARQFHQADFVDQVLAVLGQTGADPHRLKLELTESMLLDDVEVTIVKMDALKACGVGFSLDDFGTGYSSLSYLKRLPLDQLKIDRSFVSDLEWDDGDAAICAATIGMAHNLRLRVVAEGVETEAQRYFLTTAHGCDYMQGELFGRPLPLAEFEALTSG